MTATDGLSRLNEAARRLRRDVRAWRREEIYVTKAELEDRVQALPILLRKVFEPLDLKRAIVEKVGRMF